MPGKLVLDVATLLDVSHLMTFVGGAALGAAGQYLGDRFTDSRRAKEQAAGHTRQFKTLQKQMPALFQEMKDDLSRDDSSLVREFILLPNSRIIFSHSKPRFQYYEEQHPQLRAMVDLIRDAGFIEELSPANVPTYRMRDQFVQALAGS